MRPETIQRAEVTLGRLLSQEKQADAITDAHRQALLELRSRLVPVRARLRKELEKNLGALAMHDTEDAYQRACGEIARIDNALGVCDHLTLQRGL